MDCSMVKRVYHLETKDGRGHYQVLGTNNKSRNLRLRPIAPLYPKRGIIKVDEGKQSAIFLASSQRNAKKQFIIKVSAFNSKLLPRLQPSVIEYKVIQKLDKVVPGRVPKPIKFFTCRNFVPEFIWNNKNTGVNYSRQFVTCIEYIENGTFRDYLKRMSSSPRRRLNDTIMMSYIRQVLETLQKIHSKYPKFTHGDLHLGNLFVRPTKPIPQLVLGDFGWSKITKEITNPEIKSGNFKKEYGIGLNMSPMYDAHLFMMQLRKWVFENAYCSTDGFPLTKRFLNNAVPIGFRKEKDKYVTNNRLKYGVKYPCTLKSLLSFRPTRVLHGRYVVARHKVHKDTQSNAAFLRVTPESLKFMDNNNRSKRELLIAYGGGPTPNKKNVISVRANKIKSPRYK